MIAEIVIGSIICIGTIFFILKLFYKLQLNRLRRKYNESENKSRRPEAIPRGNGIIDSSKQIDAGIDELKG